MNSIINTSANIAVASFPLVLLLMVSYFIFIAFVEIPITPITDVPQFLNCKQDPLLTKINPTNTWVCFEPE